VVTNYGYTGPEYFRPLGIAVGRDGALWFANDNSIGRITTAGLVTIHVGTGFLGAGEIAAGSDGALWFTNNNAGNGTLIGRITTAGKFTTYTVAGIRGPFGITAGPDGAVWFVITNGGYSGTIGRITTTVTPEISTIAPRSGAVEAMVTITGHNLSGATQVAFNGTPATIVSDTATKIVVTVPAGATKGHITVTTRAGTATSKGGFGIS